MHMKKTLILFQLLLLQFSAKAQFLDSLKAEVGTTSTIASKDYLPLWLVSNRFGAITDQKFDFSTHIMATNSNKIGSDYLVEYGVDLYNNDHLRTSFLQEAYIRGRYKKVELTIGRFKQIIGEVDPDLSSGSLGISGNALPIPKISFSIPEYIDVPFTKGFAQFKGQFSHGWMGDKQYMKRAMLHEKNLYVRLGKKQFRLYGGIQHYAVWGGERGDVRLDRSLQGFFNVLLVNEANDGSVPDGILPNRAGDHRGVIELGAEWENDQMKIQLNNQTPFDMGQGITPKNIDRLLSLNFLNKIQGAKLKRITVEFLYTKQMNDFYASRYRESYYNNGVYKTGWEYNNNIIGTPLFTNRQRASKYYDDIRPYDWNADGKTIGMNNIVNNRVVGLHTAFLFALTKQLSSRTMVTFTKNYGGFSISNFSPSKSQFYSLQEINLKIPNSKMLLLGSLGYDWGDITNNLGSTLGIRWNVN